MQLRAQEQRAAPLAQQAVDLPEFCRHALAAPDTRPSRPAGLEELHPLPQGISRGGPPIHRDATARVYGVGELAETAAETEHATLSGDPAREEVVRQAHIPEESR